MELCLPSSSAMIKLFQCVFSYFDPSMAMIKLVCCVRYNSNDSAPWWNFYEVVLVASSSHLVGGCIQSMIDFFRFALKNSVRRKIAEVCFYFPFNGVTITWNGGTCCSWVEHDVYLLLIICCRKLLRCLFWFLLVYFYRGWGVEIWMDLGVMEMIAFPLPNSHVWSKK